MQARVDLRPVGCMHDPRASALLRQVVFWQRARQIDLPGGGELFGVIGFATEPGYRFPNVPPGPRAPIHIPEDA